MSLLLDALKKAAEEKLQKQQSEDNTVVDDSEETLLGVDAVRRPGITELDNTQADIPETTELSATEVDSTQVDDEESNTQVDITKNDTSFIDEDLTTFDIEPLEQTGDHTVKTSLSDNTEIGNIPVLILMKYQLLLVQKVLQMK